MRCRRLPEAADEGRRIVRDALAAFKTMLERLASVPADKFILVDAQGTLVAEEWANELHPHPGGFKKLA